MEKTIGQYVKTNGNPKNTHCAARMPIVNSTPVNQIHSEVKRQVDTTHIGTDEKLLLLIQELQYPMK